MKRSLLTPRLIIKHQGNEDAEMWTRHISLRAWGDFKPTTAICRCSHGMCLKGDCTVGQIPYWLPVTTGPPCHTSMTAVGTRGTSSVRRCRALSESPRRTRSFAPFPQKKKKKISKCYPFLSVFLFLFYFQCKKIRERHSNGARESQRPK